MSREMDAKNKFFLRLPQPHDHIIITCPRLEDADDVVSILNNEAVYPWMGAGLPFPHTQEHALRWLNSVKTSCDLAQEHLRAALDGKAVFIPQCPVRILRQVTEDQEIYIGDCGITRWNFIDVPSEIRVSLKRENEEKIAGDPTIVWTIGDYLEPSLHGQGIMTSAIGVLIGWATVNMNVRHMRTTAIEGNKPSVMVLKKNGFVVEKTLPNFALKQGNKVGLHVLDWKASL